MGVPIFPYDESNEGDMDHTHLVKGLDYALLRKVLAQMGSLTFEKPSKKHHVMQV